jgi:predicted nucleotidyltransferase
VRRWPAAAEVLEQAGRWAAQQISDHPDLVAVGVFGSYGRGTAGVGSDLDLLLYSLEEWRSLPQWNPKLAEALLNDTRWLGGTPDAMAFPELCRFQGDGVVDG